MAKVPFRYPKVKHRRTQNPGPFNQYGRYRPFLKIEFFSKCVYCQISDGAKGADTFEVDHYRPQKKFKHLAAEYTNLFYSCSTCNRKKGGFWPSEEQRKKGLFIPNPCDYVMFEHLRYQGVEARPQSKAGDWTIRHLDLNEPERVKYREFIVDTGRYFERVERQLIDDLATADSAEETRELEDDLVRLRALIRRLVGDDANA